MEQQIQGREQRRQEEPTQRDAKAPQPERERVAGPGQLALAALEGVPLWEMPPSRLEELASLVGNQGMAALLERQSLPVEETRLTLPEDGETTPFPVPGGSEVLTARPPGLTEGETGGRAFDPAGLMYGGGGAYE